MRISHIWLIVFIAVTVFSCQNNDINTTPHQQHQHLTRDQISKLIWQDEKKYDFIWKFYRSQQEIYVGMEEMCIIDTAGNRDCFGTEEFIDTLDDGTKEIYGSRFNRWFYRIKIALQNDTIVMIKDPCYYQKGYSELVYSAADGGFPRFYGKLQTVSKDTFAYLQLVYYKYLLPETQYDTLTGNIHYKTYSYCLRKLSNGIYLNDKFYVKVPHKPL